MTGTNNPTELVPLSLEETGWLCHLMMGDAVQGKHNPIVSPRVPEERRFAALYKRLSAANDRLMGKVPS